MGERKKRIGGTGMKWYAIGKTLTPLDRAPESGAAVVLLNSDELAHETALPGLEAVLHHTPSTRDAHVCKAEVRSNCLSGTLALPRGRRDGTRLCCGYLVTKDRVVLVDDGEMVEPYLKRIVKEKRLTENSVGRFLYDFFELLIARDLHRLEEIEDRATALEGRVLSGELEEFSTPMSELRKETMAWYRYYSQLDDVACELRENENGYFSDEECGLFRLFEERVIRLREESQLLREYCTQIQSLFQSEIDIRQNHRDDDLPAADAAGRLVRHELFRHAGAALEVRLSRDHSCERRRGGAEPVGVQKEKILVRKRNGTSRSFFF